MFRFTNDQLLSISSPQRLGINKTFEAPIGKPTGRVYFRKFYESQLLDAYFTRFDGFLINF